MHEYIVEKNQVGSCCSWHVRNKDNIERVRRDEENARKEEEERLRKVALAESEARTEALRTRAKGRQRNDDQIYEKDADIDTPTSHINFFAQEEEGIQSGGKNSEYEREKKEEREKREQAVGLLKYLGQGAVETQTDKPWYYTGQSRVKEETDQKRECDTKKKNTLDPMHMMRKYVSAQRKLEGREPEPPPKKFKPTAHVKLEEKDKKTSAPSSSEEVERK